MASSRCLFFVTLLFFSILFQQNILVSSVEVHMCLNPKFDANKKITIDYFFTTTDEEWPDKDICQIVNNSNGLISIQYRMISDMKDKGNCNMIENCLENRRFACNYKFYQDRYNDCNKDLPSLEVDVTDCVCAGAADDILTGNYAELGGYGLKYTPALIVDKKHDLCLTDFSLEGLKTYFCRAYNNVLPICNR